MKCKALAVVVLLALPISAVLTPAAASAGSHAWRAAPHKPALSPLLRHDVTIPTKLPAGAHLRSSATSRTSVIPAPTGGTAQSTWQVSYTGFDSTSNPNGPAAQAAFQAAVNIWSDIVSSTVPIKVNAQFAALPTGVLGSAGPSELYTDGSGVYFASALADALSGSDVAAQVGGPSEDIDAQFTNAAAADWYYGTDGNDPAGDIDFESVVLHELGHGLGFLGDMSVSGGSGGYQVPFAYDANTYDAATGGTPLLNYTNNSASLAAALQSQSVYWGGPVGVQNDGGARPKLYAPASWQSGSSYSHLDETTYGIGNANSLMTPAISANEVIHDPGPIAVGMLIDEGWQATLPSLVAVPDAPTGVGASAGNGQATVSWTAPSAHNSPITGYTVTSSPGGLTCSTTSATSCTVTGLTNGTSYTFTVTATNAVGTSAASAASTAVTPVGPPGKPTSVTATAGDGSALVQWVAPSNGGSAITGYTATSSPGSLTCSTTSATSCTVTGLTNGTSYTFTVTASNGVGTGSASAASSAVTPAGVPHAPTNVVASAGNTTAGVSWTAAVANGSAVSAYHVTSSPGGLTCSTGGTTGCTVSGLTNGTAYTFTVTATNAVGTSAASAASTAVTPVGPPGRPTSVTATAGDGSALVQWVAPSNGGSAITGYTATSSPGSLTCSTTSATSCTVTGLTNGTSYTFTVTASNGVGTGSASSASSAVTPAGVPHAPTNVIATAGNTTVAVSWAASVANGSPVNGYTATASPGGLTCTTTGATSCTVLDLTNGTSYTFTVTATNAIGTSAASSPSAGVQPTGPAATVPDAPGAAPDVAAGNASATVTWTAPAYDGGHPVTGYDVEYSANGYGWTSASSSFHSDNSTTQVVTGLANGTSYAFRVAAINSVGKGSYSAASSAVTPSAPPKDASRFQLGPNQTVGYGHSTSVSATLIDKVTSANLDAPVELLSRTGTVAAFASVQQLNGSPDGLVSVTVKPTITTQYEFYFAGSPGHASIYSTPVTVSVAPGLTARLTKSKVSRRHKVELYGAVSPATSGAVVWLQRKSGSTWKTLSVHAAEKKQKLPNGKKALGYVLRIPTGKKGAASYRALVKATSSRVAGSSAPQRLRVR